MSSGLNRILQILLLVSAGANAVQGFRIQAVARERERLIDKNILHEGELLPALASLGPAGERERVVPEHGTRPVVIYWMRPDCPWCAKNEANFRALVSAASDSYDIVAVSSRFDGLSTFVENTRPPYKVVGPPAPDDIARYKFGATPMTIVLSADRVVQRIWRGAYEDSKRQQVEEFFKVTLPGLLY
jgi:hypothetical protein